MLFLARIGPDSGVLPYSQHGEKEASKVYLSTKKINAILRLMVEDRINQAIEKVEDYGYAESIEIKEHKHIKGGVIIEAILPDVSDIMDEVLGFL